LSCEVKDYDAHIDLAGAGDGRQRASAISAAVVSAA
jgi:hypothetical protein